MGDTLYKMATEISRSNSNFTMWDRDQIIVILSTTNYEKDTIFFGNKNDTLKLLKEILTRKTQWAEYMEKVLSMVTINSTN